MNILGISGSASENSSNYYLLKAIASFLKEKHNMEVFQGLYDFDLFSPKSLVKGIPANISDLKQEIVKADFIILSTPEYAHNIPAVLKNLMEWCTHSGEFSEKLVLPITFTPNPPRGANAMHSLIPTLTTLNAKVVASLSLYRTDMLIKNHQIELNAEVKEMLLAILDMF